jgi:small subunit ribosomal protein S16
MTKPATIDIDRMKAFEWLNNGAQPSETVRAILRFKGVLYYKHLQRGVSKGAMTAEDAELKFRAWVDEKEARIAARVKITADERKERAAQISGSVQKAPKKKVAVEEPQDELMNVNLAEKAAAETANDVETAPEVVAEATIEVPEEFPAETPAEEPTPAETPAEEPAPEEEKTEG